MKLSDIKFDTDSQGNIILIFPQIDDNKLFLTDYKLPSLFKEIKNKIGKDEWNNLKNQIRDM